MNVAILVSSRKADMLVPLLRKFRSLGIDAFGLKMGSTWENLKESRIDEHLSKATHYLVVCCRETFSSTWFPYAIGRSERSSYRLSLYLTDDSLQIPGYVADLSILSTESDIGSYYRIAHDEWVRLESERRAKSELLAMGISIRGDSFSDCVKDGDLHAVDLFLKAGFPADSRDKHGVPMICIAARNHHRGILELLLSAGADVDIQSEDRGFTALMDSVSNGSDEIVEYLVNAKANLDLLSKDGQSALVIAVGKSAVRPTELLVRGGANPDLPDKLGFTARKYAKLFHKPEIVTLFEALPVSS